MAQLKARRDELDNVERDRRRQEDDQLSLYAGAVAEGGAISEKLASALAELDRQRERLQAEALTKQAAVELKKSRALAAITKLNRSVEDVAALVGLPLKRVRTMVRAGKAEQPTEEPAEASAGSPGQPTAVTSSSKSAAVADGATAKNSGREISAKGHSGEPAEESVGTK